MFLQTALRALGRSLTVLASRGDSMSVLVLCLTSRKTEVGSKKQLWTKKQLHEKSIYDIVTDNSDKNYKLTYVFMKTPISNRFIIFKTIYYKDKAEQNQSNFSVVMYGKNIKSGKTNERLIKKRSEKIIVY